MAMRTVSLVPRIETMLTGVTYYEVWPSGKTRLHYEDGTTETARLPVPVPEGTFAITSAVQAKRTK